MIVDAKDDVTEQSAQQQVEYAMNTACTASLVIRDLLGVMGAARTVLEVMQDSGAPRDGGLCLQKLREVVADYDACWQHTHDNAGLTIRPAWGMEATDDWINPK